MAKERPRCRDCVNWTKFGCVAMIVPFRDMSCFMTLEQLLDVELSLANYPQASPSGRLAAANRAKKIQKELERRKKDDTE